MKTNNPNIRLFRCSTHDGKTFRQDGGMSTARDTLHSVVKGRSTISVDGNDDVRSFGPMNAIPKGISPPRGDLPKVLLWPQSELREHIFPGGRTPVFQALTEVDVGKSPPLHVGPSPRVVDDDRGRSVSFRDGARITAPTDILMKSICNPEDPMVRDVGESPPLRDGPLNTAFHRCRGRSAPVRNGTQGIVQKETDLGPQRYLAEPGVRDVDIGESPPQRDGLRNTADERCRRRSVPVPFAPEKTAAKGLCRGSHRYVIIPFSSDGVRGNSPPLQKRGPGSNGGNSTGSSVPNCDHTKHSIDVERLKIWHSEKLGVHR